MPTMNPRVNVTLSPSLDSLVVRLAGLQGVSKSQVLRELLEAAEPALQRAAALMDAASRSRGEVLSGLARSLESAQDMLERRLSAELSRADAAIEDLVVQAEAVRGRRPGHGRKPGVGASSPGPGAPLGGGNPPASNRGVKSGSGARVGGSRRVRP